MNYWYALFVKTGYEDLVRRQLKTFDFCDKTNIFIPTKERIIKLPSQIKKERKAMFPGYMFIETDANTEDFGYIIYRSKYYLQKILKILRYGISFEIAIKGEERKVIESLMNKERCVEASKGIIDGDRVIITGGALMGQESIIRKIDRHKRKAIIELLFFGEVRQIQVALEIVEKLPETQV
jgi:transcriptional antiterminator NusG